MSENIRENNRKRAGHIRGADIGLMIGFVLLALGSFVWFAMSRKDGRVLRISCDGQTVVNAPLSQIRPQKMTGRNDGTTRYCLIVYKDEGVSCQWYDTKPELTSAVSDAGGYNLLAVSESGISMAGADCRDQICVHHVPIAGGGESIICLPHKLVVEITGGPDMEAKAGTAETEKEDQAAWNGGRRGYETNG